jgi:hypothetical protein
MTTHLLQKSKYSSLGGKMVPACRNGSVRGADGYFVGTEVRADVDCKRCAKLGGFEPKAKKGSDNPGGTCQICFAVQRVMGGKTMALHGYNRPGVGYISGQCPGSQHLPFEKDCALTKTHLANLVLHLGERKSRLVKLEAGEVVSLPVQVQMKDRTYGVFTISKGDERRYGVEGVRFNALPSFEEAFRHEVFEVKSTIRHLELDIASLKKALTGWAVKELLP